MSHGKTKKQIYRLIRGAIRCLPRKQRYFIFRNAVKVPKLSHKDIVFKIADNQEELEQAFALLYQTYVSVGLQKKNNSGLRVTPYHALPSTTTLIAVKEQKVIATLSLIADSPYGLPSDEAADLSQIRKTGQRIVEVSALAIKKEYRGQLLLPLLKFMYEYCIRCFAVDILIATLASPTKAHELYESILAFKPLQRNPEKDYSFSNYIPVIVEFLDLNRAKDIFARFYAYKKQSKDLYTYFTVFKDKRFSLPQRKYYHTDDPVMSPQLMDYFFNRATSCFEQLSMEERAKLYRIFPTEEYRQLLPGLQNLRMLDARKEGAQRFHVKCKGKFKSQSHTTKILVLDVSREGFKAILNEELKDAQELLCHIQVGEFEVTELTCQRVWSDQQQCGFQILKKMNQKWDEFINYLEGNKEQNLIYYKEAA